MPEYYPPQVRVLLSGETYVYNWHAGTSAQDVLEFLAIQTGIPARSLRLHSLYADYEPNDLVLAGARYTATVRSPSLFGCCWGR